jgi:hypothetical protein
MWARIAGFVGGIILLASCSQTPPAASLGQRSPFDPAVIANELQTDRPYVISVLGDSTSIMPGAWVYLVSARIADKYRRAVTVHDWDMDLNAFADVTTFGSGAPVTVWNGSARAQSAQYSLKWYRQMVPEPVDLTIINHTHNNPWNVVQGVSDLVDYAYQNTRPGGGVVVTLQNPRTDAEDRGKLEQQVTDELRTVYSEPRTGVVLVDVNKAFSNDDVSVLLKPDGVHPSDKGSHLWADTVMSSLELN